MHEYDSLSLTSRLAVALHCFERYCQALGLAHPEIGEFVDYLWEFPVVFRTDRWGDWEENRPPLVEFGLGDPCPPDLEAVARAKGIDLREFRRLVESVVEIVFSSFFGASQDELSLRYLQSVFAITSQAGVSPPKVEPYRNSRFSDEYGWGRIISREERDFWRSQTD